MPDFSQLTDRQKEIYDFIEEKIEVRGYGPTVREIGLAFGIKSPNGVMCHLKALQKKGLIRREPNMSRAIEFLQETPGGNFHSLKLLGRIAAGQPLEPVEDAEDFGFDEWQDPRKKFGLQV